MGAISSQITSLTIVYSTVYSDAEKRNHQSSASLAFVRGIHRGPVNSPHKWPVTRKMFPFGDVFHEVSATLFKIGRPQISSVSCRDLTIHVRIFAPAIPTSLRWQATLPFLTGCLFYQYNGVTNYYHTPYFIDLINQGSVLVPDFDIPVPEQFVVSRRPWHLYVAGSGNIQLGLVGENRSPCSILALTLSSWGKKAGIL